MEVEGVSHNPGYKKSTPALTGALKDYYYSLVVGEGFEPSTEEVRPGNTPGLSPRPSPPNLREWLPYSSPYNKP